jgi:hypothetical protein
MLDILKCEFTGADIINRVTAQLREILNWTMNHTSKGVHMYVKNVLSTNVTQSMAF